VRITKRDDGANGVIRWEGQFTDASVYTQDEHDAGRRLAGRDGSRSRADALPAARHPAPARCRRHYGFYGAALGYLDGWRGAQVYVSRDGGASYDRRKGPLPRRVDHRLCRDGAREPDPGSSSSTRRARST
jgi:hypothetical protein